MRLCSECEKKSVRKIQHFSKTHRCGNCRSEFRYSKWIRFLSSLSLELAIPTGIILGLIVKSWLVVIIISGGIPLMFEYLLKKHSKLVLVGLRAKLKEKGL